MSYQEMADIYQGPERSRIHACVRQQGLLFTADARQDIRSLGNGVVNGVATDIDAVIAAVCFGPNWADIEEDAALLSAVQAQWPTVAAARYPDQAAEADAAGITESTVLKARREKK